MEQTVLTGRSAQLEPLGERHREGLRAAADDERIWTHTLTDARGPEFDRWFDEALARRAAGQQFPFAVRRLADQALIGSTSFLDPAPRHGRVEIGSTWYTPAAWGTEVNPECKLLLLAHAFEALGMNRVSLCTDVRNTRSQAAIEKLGAVREGVLRAHMVTQGGRVRDSVLYSIVAGDWPRVRERLTARLARGGPPAGRPASPAGNKAVVRRYYEGLWNRWDFALADELLAEGLTFRGSLGVSVRGREGFRGYMEAVRRAFPDFHNRVEELIAEGDTVMARLTYTGTHRGELFGVPPTGRFVTYAGVAIFRFAAGRITEGWVLGDVPGLMDQLRGPAG
jgi:steroid delta-isomerase-like uncharacterized protein